MIGIRSLLIIFVICLISGLTLGHFFVKGQLYKIDPDITVSILALLLVASSISGSTAACMYLKCKKSK